MKLFFALVLCLTLIIMPLTTSYSEPLPSQYGEKVTVTAEITKIKINYNGAFADFNDPLGIGTGEIALLYSFSEPEHNYIVEKELNLPGWDLQWHDSVPHNKPTTDRESINKRFSDQTKYVHVECHDLDTLNGVFTVYNVNGNWPDWEGILKDSAKAAGFASLRQLAIATGYLASEGATMGGLLVAAVAAVAIQQIVYTIRGNESLGVGTLEVDLSEFGDNDEETYTVKTEKTNFGNAEIDVKVTTSTEEIDCADLETSHSGLHQNEFYAMLDEGFTAPEIPGWVKSNAFWWSEGQIDDKTFALAIGYLVKTDVINLSSQYKTSTGNLKVSDNLTIPAWIKNNAAWWSEGIISDVDFKEGIRYMVNEKIISFSKPSGQSKPISNILEDLPPNPKLAKLIFETNKKNEIVMQWLLAMKNFEADILDKASREAWNYYGQNKNQEVLLEATQLDENANQAQEDVRNSLSSLKKTQGLAEEAKEYAIKVGVSETEIDEIDDQFNDQIELIPSAFETISDLDFAKDKAQQAQEDADNSMRDTLKIELKEKFSTLPGLDDFTEAELDQLLQESIKDVSYEGSYVGAADYLTGLLYNDYNFYLTAFAPDVYILIMSMDPTGKLWDLFVQTLILAQLQSESNPRYYYAIRDYSEIVESKPVDPVLPFVLIGPEELIDSLNDQANESSEEGVDTESTDSANTINTKMGKVPVYASDCPPINGKGTPGDTIHVFINQGGVFNFETVRQVSTVVDENGDWEIILDPPCLEDGLYDIGISYEHNGVLSHNPEFPIIVDTGSGITKDYIVHTLGETLHALDSFEEEKKNMFMDRDTTDFLRFVLEEYGDKLDESHRDTLEDLIDAEDDYYVDPFDDDYDPTYDIPVYPSELEYYDTLEVFLAWLYNNFGDLPVDDFWKDQRIKVAIEQPGEVNFDTGPWLFEINDSRVWYPEVTWGHHKLLEFLEGDIEEIAISQGVALDSEGDEIILNNSKKGDLSAVESQNGTKDSDTQQETSTGNEVSSENKDTSCSGYYFDSSCVSKCPENYTPINGVCTYQTPEPEEEPLLYVIDVTMINGLAYPSFQFVVYPPYSGCSEEYLRPAAGKYNTAFHTFFDEIGLTFDGGGCGNFGKVSEVVSIPDYPITERQAQYLEDLFGFEDFRDRPYNP